MIRQNCNFYSRFEIEIPYWVMGFGDTGWTFGREQSAGRPVACFGISAQAKREGIISTVSTRIVSDPFHQASPQISTLHHPTSTELYINTEHPSISVIHLSTHTHISLSRKTEQTHLYKADRFASGGPVCQTRPHFLRPRTYTLATCWGFGTCAEHTLSSEYTTAWRGVLYKKRLRVAARCWCVLWIGFWWDRGVSGGGYRLLLMWCGCHVFVEFTWFSPKCGFNGGVEMLLQRPNKFLVKRGDYFMFHELLTLTTFQNNVFPEPVFQTRFWWYKNLYLIRAPFSNQYTKIILKL